MTTKKYFGILLIIISGHLMASHAGCHGFCSPGNQDNSLNLKGGTVTITPDNDSIRVGDTLWLKSVIPTRLTELNVNGDGSTINFSGATNVATDFHLNVAVRSDTLIGGIDSFEYLPVKGHIKANSLIPHAGKTVYYIEDGDSYQFICGLVAMKKRDLYNILHLYLSSPEKVPLCIYTSDNG